MNIYYFPFELDSNSYVSRNKEILSRIATVNRLPSPQELSNIFKMFLDIDKSVVILNWYEDRACSKGLLKFIVYVFYLIFIFLKFKKILWIKHNFKPHNKSNVFMHKFIVRLLDCFSDVKLTHRPIIGYQYLPHVNYCEKSVILKDDNRTIDNLIFGQIKRYKGIVELLSEWPDNKEIYIIGQCNDERLNQEILEIIESRNLKVDYINKFIDDNELKEILLNTRNVIIPHLDDSMIVSGVFYHSASFGANVSVRCGDFYSYLSRNFSFVNKIDDYEVEYIKPSAVVRELIELTSNDVVLNYYKYYIT